MLLLWCLIVYTKIFWNPLLGYRLPSNNLIWDFCHQRFTVVKSYLQNLPCLDAIEEDKTKITAVAKHFSSRKLLNSEPFVWLLKIVLTMEAIEFFYKDTFFYRETFAALILSDRQRRCRPMCLSHDPQGHLLIQTSGRQRSHTDFSRCPHILFPSTPSLGQFLTTHTLKCVPGNALLARTYWITRGSFNSIPSLVVRSCARHFTQSFNLFWEHWDLQSRSEMACAVFGLWHTLGCMNQKLKFQK